MKIQVMLLMVRLTPRADFASESRQGGGCARLRGIERAQRHVMVQRESVDRNGIPESVLVEEQADDVTRGCRALRP